MLFLLFFLLIGEARAQATPTVSQLESAVGARIMRTPEFQFVRQEAEKLGVKVYLFGGTAASFAHYVRQDLLNESTGPKSASRTYDYDYTDIFRSTQDLDLVVDGTAEQAEKLEKALKSKYPHFVGGKVNQWEVRPLRFNRGEKEAILGNPNFLNQHTDSHSTGLIEVTPNNSGRTVRDVRDWDSATPNFLKDVADQKLHYYFSPKHSETHRFKEGKNPPIISAIRCLTKAFQYDLAISTEDSEKIRNIVKNFDPKNESSPYVAQWIEKNGKKLFQHAVDLERASVEIERYGLRKKLLEVSPKVDQADTLGWWINREPLRTKPLGQGEGKTAGVIAAELGLSELIVAHETRGFLAFESLTRDRSGELNAFISRQGKTGETALFGDGFYTRLGRQGAAHTGYTIRMSLDPKAREGTDFERTGDDYFIIKNKAAVRVIPEELKISLPEYFRQIAETGKGWDIDDLALIEKMRRKAGREGIVSRADLEKIKSFVLNDLAKAAGEKHNAVLLAEWLRLPESTKDLSLVKKILSVSAEYHSSGNKGISPDLLTKIFSEQHWVGNAKVIELLADHEPTSWALQRVALDLLGASAWTDRPEAAELIQGLIKRNATGGEIAAELLANEPWRSHAEWPKLWRSLIQSTHSLNRTAETLISLGPARDNSNLLLEILATGRGDQSFSRLLTNSQDDLWKNSVLPLAAINALVDRGSVDKELAEYHLTSKHWRVYPDWSKWFRKVLDRGQQDRHLASSLRYLEEPELTQAFESMMKRGNADREIAEALGLYPLNRHPKMPTWLTALAARSREAESGLLVNVFDNFREKSKPINWAQVPEAVSVIENLAHTGRNDESLALLLKANDWVEHSRAGEWIKKIILRGNPKAIDYLASWSVLKNPRWHRYHRLLGAEFDRVNYNINQLVAEWQRSGLPQYLRGDGLDRQQSGSSITINCSISFGNLR